MANPVEIWKAEKHGFDVWDNVLDYAAQKAPMKDIPAPDLERMKWHGVFYRKRDTPGSYMLRIRLTGCELTAPQARAIAFVAYEYGYGIIDVTTRANIQVQGLQIDQVPKAIERLAAVGLTAKQTGHDNVRNVYGHPFSGLDPEELIDTRQLCHDITAIFLNSRKYSNLPRKFNIAINGRADHSIHYWSQDLSFVAHRTESGEVMFQVLIAGRQGQSPLLSRHLPVLVAPDQVVDVTTALLDLFLEQGSREKRDETRFCFLVEKIGVGGVLAFLEERLPFPLVPCVHEPHSPTGYENLVGWFPQKQPDRWTMGLCVTLGRLTWQQLEGLAIASARWGDGTLRATPEQGLAIANIRSGFKDAMATEAARLGLSVHSDSVALNIVACTGKQFCNIAVTETKTHAYQLIEKLRQRSLVLHGIRIHMSGCPASCAQHFAADIGLKGVRVKRLFGTSEGFDVFLGGGVSGRLELAVPYKLGVDVEQLPRMVEEVVQEYYLNHRPGQTFSAYWRERLRDSQAAAKVGDGDYHLPTWACESCHYQHQGEDPPVFCPKCAALRRHFARLEETQPAATTDAPKPAVARADGFIAVAREEALAEGASLAVQAADKTIALFRIDGKVHALDNACPHEGGPLSEGEIKSGVVTCPWHGWSFSACDGCAIAPATSNVERYETMVEHGEILVKLTTLGKAAAAKPAASKPAVAKVKTVTLKVTAVVDETPDTKTFRFDNSAGEFPQHRPGQFLKVCVPIGDREVWRSFTISSAPASRDFLDITVKRNPSGEVSLALHEKLKPGETLKVKGPQGGFCFDRERHTEPLALIAAGSGITPMMSILRFLATEKPDHPCSLLHGARSEQDAIFRKELDELSGRLTSFRHVLALSRPSPNWRGWVGRVQFSLIEQELKDLAGHRFFLCGPNDFIETLSAALQAAGVAAERIHTELFQAAPAVSMAK